MGNQKVSSAEVTNFSQKQYQDTAAFQDKSKYPSSFSTLNAPETTESEYQNTNWSTQLGVYLEISELAGMIDRKAQFVVGKGFKLKGMFGGIRTKFAISSWTGNGLDSANMIFYNAVRTYTTGGDFFAEIVRTKRGKITNLKPLNPSTVKVIANDKGIVTKYEIFPINTGGESQKSSEATIKIPKERMFHLAYNRIADQIHGQSLMDKLQPIIEMRRESMQDLRIVFHRYVKPLWVFSVDSDNEAEIKAFKDKVDSTIEKAENLIVPKGTVDKIERISIPQFSSLDPIPWLKLLQKEFYKAEGVPGVVNGVGSDSTEAESKILYLAWQQIVEFNQQFLEEQIKLQLGLDVEFEFPASIAPELIADRKKDGTKSVGKNDPSKGN